MQLIGFTTSMEECSIRIEEIEPGYSAINILEKVILKETA